MPEPFTSSVMTDKGVELLTKAQAGQCVIEFTRVAIGDGEYEEDEKTPDALKERTELKSEKNSYSITDMEIYNEKCVKVSTLITNCDPETKESIVPEGYYINEIALYAREQGGSEETLYSIAVAEEQGDFIPSYTGANLAQITQTFFVTVNNSAEVTIEDSGVVVTVDRMEHEINEMFDKIYPVGSIYMSVNATSPADLFGGAWEQIEDTFLLAAGANHAEGETGGEEAVALTASQIPSHTHSLPSHTHSLPSHTHSLPSHTHSLPSHTHSVPQVEGTTGSGGTHTHTANYSTDDSIGGSGRRYLPSGEDGSATFTNSAGAHTHAFVIPSTTTGSTSGTSGSTSGTSGGTSGTSGSVSGTSGSASGTSGSTGDGNSHNNMPPYLAVYMWKRTA